MRLKRVTLINPTWPVQSETIEARNCVRLELLDVRGTKGVLVAAHSAHAWIPLSNVRGLEFDELPPTKKAA